MSQTKISIIIPVYNMERFLRQCLNSVLSQTLPNIEIICVNDGSIDGSLSILNEYAAIDKRIVLLDQANIGVSASRNKAINMAKGEYVFFLDPDDYYPDEGVLFDLYTVANKAGASICGGSFRTIDERNGNLTTHFPESFSGYMFEEDGIVSYCDYQFDFGFHRFIYNRDFLISNNIFFPDYKRFEDPVFFVKAMHTAENFYSLSRCSYMFRIGQKFAFWSGELILDFLHGICDNLIFSRDCNLADLHALTLDRLYPYMSRYVSTTKWGQKKDAIIKVLDDIRSTIDPNLLNQSRYSFATDKMSAVDDLLSSKKNLKNRVLAEALSHDLLRKIATRVFAAR